MNNTTYNNDKTSNGIGGQTTEVTIFYTENCIIQNNIFYGGNSGSRLLSADNINAINLNLDFNLYFGNMAANFFGGISYADFTAYQTGTYQDANSIFQNPLFRTPSDNDLHITADSPAINMRNPINNIIDGGIDCDGDIRVVNGRITVGADDFKSYPNTLSLVGDLFSNSYSALQENQSGGIINQGSIVNLSAPKLIIKQESSVAKEGTLIIINDTCK